MFFRLSVHGDADEASNKEKLDIFFVFSSSVFNTYWPLGAKVNTFTP
jgi:hypothetical protein